MKSIILAIILSCLTFNADAAVRWNAQLRLWEGNICMNSIGWQFVFWQPLGSLCVIQLPGHPKMQGIIINA